MAEMTVVDIERVVEETLAVLRTHGSGQYFGEAVSKLRHAEQCAWHAAEAGADEELVLAALLHDIGHLVEDERAVVDERVGVVNHDEVGGNWLRARGFSARLAALVESHVGAKRYLTSTSSSYAERLSAASVETLRLQGGPMTDAETEEFARHPELRDALRLRSWDEMAKDPAWTGPGLESYREMMTRHLEQAAAASGPGAKAAGDF